MRGRLPTTLLVAAVALAVIGVMLAVARSSNDDGGPPSGPRDAVVSALAARPRDIASTARYIVRYILEAPEIGSREVVTYEGSADLERQRFRSRGRPRDGGEFDSFVFSEWHYTRSSGQTHWRRAFFNPRTVGAPTPEVGIVGGRGEHFVGPAYANDLEVRRQIVDALTVDVLPLGAEEQHGTTVWRYRATVEGGRAVGRLPEPVVREMARWDEGQKGRDVDLWLDGRGRLRKLSIFYDQGEGGYRVENEFWDLGRPGPLDLPSDLDDPTAVGGEGVTSFMLQPGVEFDAGSPSFAMSVFDNDSRGTAVTLHVDDQAAPAAPRRLRTIRMIPSADRHLEPGEYRLVDTRGSARPEARTFFVNAPEVDERCPPGRPRSGTLTLSEAVMYEESFYVRLHARFMLTCQASPAATPVSFTGEARYHALT